MNQFYIPPQSADVGFTILVLLTAFTVIGGFLRAWGAVYIVTYDGVIRRRPNPDWSEVKSVGIGTFGIIMVWGLGWLIAPDVMTGTVDLKALAEQVGCGFESKCTMNGMPTVAWNMLGTLLALIEAVRNILFVAVLGWIAYEAFMTHTMSEPDATKKHWKLVAASAVFFTVVLWTKPIARMAGEIIALAISRI